MLDISFAGDINVFVIYWLFYVQYTRHQQWPSKLWNKEDFQDFYTGIAENSSTPCRCKACLQSVENLYI